MRKIPIVSGSGGFTKYTKNLVSLFSDLWLYLPTDIGVSYKYLQLHGFLKGSHTAVFEYAERNQTSKPSLILAVIVATITYAISILITIGSGIFATIMTILNRRTFIPADEMIKAELESINRRNS